MDDRKRSKDEHRRLVELRSTLHELDAVRRELSLRFQRLIFDNMPFEWASIEDEVPVRQRKTRITASFDADVVKFFRAMGLGYQARMNAVLRAYMLGLLSREIRSRKNEDWKGEEI